MNKQEISTEEKKSKKSSKNWSKIGALIFTLALALFIGVIGYGYFELSKVNVSLGNTVAQLENRFSDTENRITLLDKSLNNLQAAAQKSQELSKEQQQMIEAWNAAQKGNLERWHLAEATHLIKLANDQLQFANDHRAALILLQQADQVMKSSQTPQGLELRKTLTDNIASLQAAPDVDITSLYLRLAALNKQIDQLPLPENPLKADSNQTKTVPPGLSWWRSGWEHSLNALRKVVIVRRIDADTSSPLVLPEEKNFLYQNLHAQIEQALWALLHHNQNIYAASLSRASEWIPQFFDQASPVTKAVLENIEALRKENIAIPVMDISKTVQQFNDYLKQTNQTNQNQDTAHSPGATVNPVKTG